LPRASSDFRFSAAYVRNFTGDHHGHLIGYSAARVLSIFSRLSHSKPTSIPRTAFSYANQRSSSVSVIQDTEPYASFSVKHREADKAKADFEATQGSSSSRSTTTATTTG
jgi:hypothetical protein